MHLRPKEFVAGLLHNPRLQNCLRQHLRAEAIQKSFNSFCAVVLAFLHDFSFSHDKASWIARVSAISTDEAQIYLAKPLTTVPRSSLHIPATNPFIVVLH